MHTLELDRPPVPPFSPETAATKVRMAEDAWNSRDPQRVSLACTADSRWRHRTAKPAGRAQIVQFLKHQWSQQLDYRLVKELWACSGHRIAVRFACEYRDEAGQWFRSDGNEHWEFDTQGLMTRRYASANDLAIAPDERRLHWRLGRRPDDHPGLSALGL
jgi:nuclear transport factor 2 (NTF2) superfamily protein